MGARSAPFLLLAALTLHGQAQVTYTVEALNLRPAGEDYAPTLVDSILVFTSVRARDQAIAYTDANTNKPLADLYSASLSAMPRLPLAALRVKQIVSPLAVNAAGPSLNLLHKEPSIKLGVPGFPPRSCTLYRSANGLLVLASV